MGCSGASGALTLPVHSWTKTVCKHNHTNACRVMPTQPMRSLALRLQLYPYHLAPYVCRVLRVAPFK
jgi:hypothetical protein